MRVVVVLGMTACTNVNSFIRSVENDILADNKYLSKVVSRGAEKARESASKTVREVREIIGYKSF